MEKYQPRDASTNKVYVEEVVRKYDGDDKALCVYQPSPSEKVIWGSRDANKGRNFHEPSQRPHGAKRDAVDTSTGRARCFRGIVTVDENFK
ncbi:pyruvate/2-oxoglutarate dehydrogenase complex, dihydrolipoamide dehydrogenase component [Anopheles sinensis]|uniref:Pyruvate/2-oxoglutarate dehydrogenase complex, dihydrolipoamide dehydrogenase component n=1 Tax=Anopheles sinensis TaxID=74873 RepID=A0A084WEV2_ANOSI|nr:pyruvate/2-oxoglutarate dehydrogenase complex, dihydrolipoamide dehydrogenase component [Anopheles sinensis]